MKFSYSRLQKSSDRLLNRFNEQPITVEREISGGMVDGEYIEGSISTLQVIGVAVPYNISQINNTTILNGDLQVTIKRDIEPLQSDTFLIDGGRYKVVAIQKFQPSISTLAYRVQVRK